MDDTSAVLDGFSWEQTEEKKRNNMLEALLQVCWDEYGMGKPDECTKKHANVKIVHPSWVQLNSQVQIAAAPKGRLEKQVFECAACQKDLEARGKPESKEFFEECVRCSGQSRGSADFLEDQLGSGKGYVGLQRQGRLLHFEEGLGG